MNEIGSEIFALLVSLAGIHQLSELLTSLDGLSQAAKDAFSVVGVIVCIFGLLQCFLGYKMFKFWCSVVGMLVGAAVGVSLAAAGVFAGSPAANLIGILIIIILAVSGSFIAYKAYLAGLFLYVFFAAFLLCLFLFAIITDSMITGLIVGFVLGIVMGIIAVQHRRFWIILSSSLTGGVVVGTGLMMAMQTTEIGWGYILPPVLMVLGFFIQNITTRKGSKKSEPAVEVQPVYPQAPPPVYPPEHTPTPAEYAEVTPEPAPAPTPAPAEYAAPAEQPVPAEWHHPTVPSPEEIPAPENYPSENQSPDQ